MGIQSEITLIMDFAGQNNDVIPRVGRLYCPTSTLAEITTLGFLDNYLKSQNIALVPTDFIAAVGSDGSQWYKPVVISGLHQLVVLP